MLVNLKKAGRINVGGIILIPGPNKVDARKWALVRQHPIVAHKINEGEIVEETDLEEAIDAQDSGGEAVEAFTERHLQTLKQPQALALVKETVSIPLLEAWQRHETRKPVKGAITKQINLLKEPPEKRDRSQKRQLSGSGMTPETVELQAKPSAQDD